MGKKNMWKTFFWKILSKFNTFVKRNTTPILIFISWKTQQHQSHQVKQLN